MPAPSTTSPVAPGHSAAASDVPGSARRSRRTTATARPATMMASTTGVAIVLPATQPIG